MRSMVEGAAGGSIKLKRPLHHPRSQAGASLPAMGGPLPRCAGEDI